MRPYRYRLVWPWSKLSSLIDLHSKTLASRGIYSLEVVRPRPDFTALMSLPKTGAAAMLFP